MPTRMRDSAMLAKFSKSPLLNLQKRVLTRTFIATPAVTYENDRPSFNSRTKYVSSGSRYGQSEMGERRSYQPRGNDNGRTVCYKCGSADHFIKDCPEKQVVTCYRCGQDGHIARDCTESVENERVVKCHNCGEEGHIARMCPRDPVCHNCGQPGHMSMACPEPPKPRDELMEGQRGREQYMGRRSEDGGGGGLRQHGRPMMDRRRDSELSNVNGGDEISMRAQVRDESEVVCWHCNAKGHSSRNCPTKPVEPCWNCGVEGHQSRDCPQPRKDRGTRSAAGGDRGGYRGGGHGRGGRGYGGRTSDRGWGSRSERG